MEQELVDQINIDQELNNHKKEKRSDYRDENLQFDVQKSGKDEASKKISSANRKLDLENNQCYEDDYSLDSTAAPNNDSQSHKKKHYEKLGSLKNKGSARSTSATLFALDSSRVDTQLLKYEQTKLPVYLGCHKPILWYKNKPILTIGPHWYYTLCLSISILITAYIIAENIANSFENKLWYYLLYSIVGLLLLFFSITALLNPGIATEKESDSENGQVLGTCPLCEIILDNTTFHCMDCRVCIRGFDHHCPWTSKCIGANNIHVFYIFIAFFVIFFVYSIFLCILYAF
ncbi:hypothetical protein ABPG74_008912 [Tetrahymena malaccensis]